MTDIPQNKHFIRATFISIGIATLIIYVLTALDAGQSNLLMPLDDVYIHFQYARQMAIGHPYQYNLIDPPTSGATSLIYPYLLASGYLIGFKGLWLGLWAMILGTIAMIVSIWAVYRLCKVMNVPQWLSLLTAISFGLTGSIAWHFMSGMETGIVITLTLLTLLFVIEKRLIPFLIVSTLLTISRPEAGLVSAIAAGTLFLRLWNDSGAEGKHPAKRKFLLLLAIPVLAIGLQPLVNLLITGTTVATGAQAKSILATVPQDVTLIVGRIWDNFSRMWLEFVTGYDAREGRGWYLPIFTGLTGLLAIPMLIFKKDYRLVGLMLLGCFLGLTVAISTLDNAFWHFKRYQMPMMALFFPLSAWVVAAGLRRFPKMRYPVYAFDGIVIPIFVIALFLQFQHYHAMNVSYVYQQPYQMATWLRDNTREDALVAVHDVGLMRYIGERSTLDMVGLTTPGAAAYWRNGPGSVAEFLINEQPDYIASYGRGHGYGLAYLADTSLYENQLADFTISDWQPHLNVALAAASQGIYQPCFVCTPDFLSNSVVGYALKKFDFFDESLRVAEINVGDVESEKMVQFSFITSPDFSGFATEYHRFENNIYNNVRNVMESFPLEGGVRAGLTEQQFTVFVSDTSTDLVAISRYHAAGFAVLDIYANDTYVATRIITNNPGKWLDIAFVVPTNILTSQTTIRIVSQDDALSFPEFHQLFSYTEVMPYFYDGEAVAEFNENNFLLDNFAIDRNPGNYRFFFDWYTASSTTGDYRLFVHLYDDIDMPPVAQYDNYPYSGQLPPQNWLTGLLSDQIFIETENLPPGTYQLAIGFYNPNDPTDRLIPESDIYEVTPDGRLWLGEVVIE